MADGYDNRGVNRGGFAHWPVMLQGATLFAIIAVPVTLSVLPWAISQATRTTAVETEMADFLKAAAASASATDLRLTQDEGRIKEVDQEDRERSAEMQTKLDHLLDMLNDLRIAYSKRK